MLGRVGLHTIHAMMYDRCVIDVFRLDKALVLLAALCSIELWDEPKPSPELKLPAPVIVVPTQSHGGSFWSSMFIALVGTPQQKFWWHLRERDGLGVPTSEPHKVLENDMVGDWIHKLTGCGLPKPAHERIENGQQAVQEDFDTRQYDISL